MILAEIFCLSLIHALVVNDQRRKIAKGCVNQKNLPVNNVGDLHLQPTQQYENMIIVNP
jgi:hypothetical protein